MTVWWRGAGFVSAVGAGVLVLGASGVYAVQMDEPAPLPLDLAAVADPGTWARGSRVDQVIRYRIRLRGPGTDARLAVLTTPAEALRGIECSEETRSSAPLPKGVGVCMVGALPAEGGTVDVLLAVPDRPQDITVSALARMNGPDGKLVRQQAQSTIKSSDAVMRGGGVAGGLDTLEHARAAREARSAETRPGAGAPGAASMVLSVPQAVEETGGVPLVAPGVSEAQRAEQRMSAFLLDLAGKSFVLPAPKPGEAGANGAAGVPAGPVAPGLPPQGTRLPDGAAAPGAEPEAGTDVPGQGQAAVPPAEVPAAPTLQGQNGRNHSAMGSQTGRKAAGRKAHGQRHAAGRSGARGQGANRQALRQTGPGRPVTGLPGVPQPVPGQPGLQQMGPVHPGIGQKTAGRPGARPPVVGPMVPGYPGGGQWPAAGQPAVPGQGMAGRPGAGLQGAGQPMPQGYPGGQPMPQGYPGMAGPPGTAGQPGVPQQGPGGPMGGPMAPGHPGTVQQPGGPQMPGAQPGGPQAPGGMTPPISMGMAGAGQMPGLVNGLQLPQAGPLPAAQVPLPQDPRPQGAPLPQDLDGPNGQVRPVAESSPLTGVTGLPAVGAAVGALLGLLWLQRRIQRRRRSRHVL